MTGNDGTWEERTLRAAALSGDEAAWRVLYDRHFDALYGYVYWRAGRHPQRAEEVVQECWAVAVRRMRRFDPERGPFYAWLRGIADKVLRNHHRRWQRRDRTELPNASDASLTGDGGAATAGGTSAVTATRSLEQAEHIGMALTTLPPRYQAALRAKYEEGLSVAEVADQWGTTPKAVESLLSRARAAFREAYKLLDRSS